MRRDLVRRLTERFPELLSCLRTTRQRRLLSVLQDASSPMTVRDLAVQVAAHEVDTAPADVPPATLQRCRVSLQHVDLPRLVAAGLVERRAEGYVVDGRLPLEVLAFATGDLSDGDERRWEAIAAMLSRPRRRAIVEALADRGGPVGLEDLAAEVAARQASYGPPARAVDAAMLHHVDVPMLADVGLVTYDVPEQSVTPGSVLADIVEWLDAGGEGTVSSRTGS